MLSVEVLSWFLFKYEFATSMSHILLQATGIVLNLNAKDGGVGKMSFFFFLQSSAAEGMAINPFHFP